MKDQIAAEATLMAKEFTRKCSVDCSLADELFLTRLIKSAIEKAFSNGWHEGVRQCARKQEIEKSSTK